MQNYCFLYDFAMEYYCQLYFFPIGLALRPLSKLALALRGVTLAYYYRTGRQ